AVAGVGQVRGPRATAAEIAEVQLETTFVELGLEQPRLAEDQIAEAVAVHVAGGDRVAHVGEIRGPREVGERRERKGSGEDVAAAAVGSTRAVLEYGADQEIAAPVSVHVARARDGPAERAAALGAGLGPGGRGVRAGRRPTIDVDLAGAAEAVGADSDLA